MAKQSRIDNERYSSIALMDIDTIFDCGYVHLIAWISPAIFESHFAQNTIYSQSASSNVTRYTISIAATVFWGIINEEEMPIINHASNISTVQKTNRLPLAKMLR